MSRLDVFLHDDPVGRLDRLENAKLRFTYADEHLAEGRTPLSLSLPLQAEPFEDAEARPFFAGLLPEGDFLRSVAREFQVSAKNPFSLLNEIGGECAGAVSLMPPGAKPQSRREPMWLTLEMLDELIATLPRRPLSVAIDGETEELRMSLAGAQQKLPVLFQGGDIGITRGRPPSTHIIKLPDPTFEGLVANEAYCLALAAAVGLDTVEASPWHTGAPFASRTDDATEFLLVTRYDRSPDGHRIHQEDFCQALGRVPELKYQAEGGPDVASCAKLIRTVGAAPAVDLLTFADALIFNLVIGNHDAHAKNYSLILEGDRSPRMAPLYDLVSTVAYPGLRRKLAMKYGGEYRPDYLESRHFERLASDLGMAAPAFARRARELCRRLADQARPVAEELEGRHSGFGRHPVIARIIEQIDRAAARASTTLSELIGSR